MKRRVFALLAMVVILIPLVCISASAFTMDSNVSYPDGKWYHFQKYVASGYTGRQQNDGMEFLARFIDYYQQVSNGKELETLHLGLDLDQYYLQADGDYSEGHQIFFDTSYYSLLKATGEAGSKGRLVMNWDCVWSLSFHVGDKDYELQGLGGVFMEVGKKAPKEGDPAIPMINLYFRRSSEEVEGNISQVMFQYWIQTHYTGDTYIAELNNIQYRQYQDGGWKTWGSTYCDLYHTAVGVLSLDFPVKGDIASDAFGSLCAFPANYFLNGKLCLSRWYYPREFFAGADMIYNNTVVGSASYQNGYDSGYSFGYEDGNASGYAEGNAKGFAEGKAEGLRIGEAAGIDMQNLIIGIFEAPSVLIDSMLDFDLFGINVSTFVKTILTLSISAVVVYFVFKLLRG